MILKIIKDIKRTAIRHSKHPFNETINFAWYREFIPAIIESNRIVRQYHPVSLKGLK